MTRLSRAERFALDAEIVRLTHIGMTQQAIGERLGVSATTVARTQRAGGVSRGIGWAREAEHDAEIIQLGRDGLTQREIADRVGLSVGTVGNVLRRAGIKRTSSWARRAPEVDRRIVALVTQTDLTYAEIAREVGCSPATVQAAAKVNGVARGAGRRPDPERDRRIADLWEQGATCDEIRAATGISLTGLAGARERLGLPPRKRGGRLDPERDRRIADLWAQGVTRAEIAATLGISASGLTRAVRRLDLPRRKPGRPRTA